MMALLDALSSRGFRLLGLLLLSLTIMALLPWDPVGPFDARDYSRLEGVSLSYPWWGVILEPLFAPAQVLMGAPDFRHAILASGAWLIVASALMVLWSAWYEHPRRHPLFVAWRLLLVPGVSLALFLAYVISAAVLYFPSWKLEVDKPGWIVADFQSHTLGSHDGMFTAQKSLSWHRERGYDLFAVTEHKDASGSFAAMKLADTTPDAPAVIPGVEINSEHEDFILGIGLQNNDVLPYTGNEQDYSRRFIDDIHNKHNGATIALSWELAPERVASLVEAGIDGFEIVNTGHPDVSLELRAELLRAAQQEGVVMLASTDTHGWGGLSRTWTLINIPDAEQLSHAELAARTVSLLRAHRQEAFVPVVSGYMGPVPMLRTLLTPFTETARYGAELSLPRLASWWSWFFLLVATHGWLKRRRISTGASLLAAGSMGLGAALLVRASELLGMWPQIPAIEYTIEMGQHVLQVGLLSLGIGIIVAVREIRQRRARTA